MQKTKAFTLIELLVVIAIIGILSGLIIVSMSGAQNSAKDARIKAAMDQFRSTAEIYKLNNAGYGSNLALAACTATATSLLITGSDGLALCNDIQSQGSGALIIDATSTGYCISKVLNGGTTWCLDSKGNVGAPAGSCDATNYDCL